MAKDQSRIQQGVPSFDFSQMTDAWAAAQPALDFDPFRRAVETQAQMNTRIFGSADPTGTAKASSGGTTKESTGQTASASGGLMDALSGYFMRGVVIVLGFIFVAVGLSMFKVPAASAIIQAAKPK